MASRYVYNTNTLRYRDTITGRFVSQLEVMRAIDDRIDMGFGQLDALLQNVLNPATSYNMQDLQTAFLAELRNQHIQSYVVGVGGRHNMTQSDWAALGGKLRSEYRYARDFIQEIDAGGLTERQIRARLALYADGARNSLHKGIAAQVSRSGGFTEMRRTLNPADHCGDCLAYANQGWQPIGILPLPGEASECRNRCKCDVEYR